MPRLWNETIEAHRQDVRDAIMQATARLVAAGGLRAVTMSQIAETSGIGRATLYKYFPTVEAILGAWHERQIDHHLEHLAEVAERAGDAALEPVLRAYALMLHETRERHDGDLAASLHRSEHVTEGHRRLHSFVRKLVEAAVHRRALREDVPPDELTTYCLQALTAAGRLSSRAAVERLVTVTLSGLRPT